MAFYREFFICLMIFLTSGLGFWFRCALAVALALGVSSENLLFPAAAALPDSDDGPVIEEELCVTLVATPEVPLSGRSLTVAKPQDPARARSSFPRSELRRVLFESELTHSSFFVKILEHLKVTPGAVAVYDSPERLADLASRVYGIMRDAFEGADQSESMSWALAELSNPRHSKAVFFQVSREDLIQELSRALDLQAQHFTSWEDQREYKNELMNESGKRAFAQVGGIVSAACSLAFGFFCLLESGSYYGPPSFAVSGFLLSLVGLGVSYGVEQANQRMAHERTLRIFFSTTGRELAVEVPAEMNQMSAPSQGVALIEKVTEVLSALEEKPIELRNDQVIQQFADEVIGQHPILVQGWMQSQKRWWLAFENLLPTYQEALRHLKEESPDRVDWQKISEMKQVLTESILAAEKTLPLTRRLIDLIEGYKSYAIEMRDRNPNTYEGKQFAMVVDDLRVTLTSAEQFLVLQDLTLSESSATLRALRQVEHLTSSSMVASVLTRFQEAPGQQQDLQGLVDEAVQMAEQLQQRLQQIQPQADQQDPDGEGLGILL